MQGVPSERTLGFVDLYFECSTVCLTLHGPIGNLAEVAGQLGKMVEHRNQIQPNPGLRAHGTPCSADDKCFVVHNSVISVYDWCEGYNFQFPRPVSFDGPTHRQNFGNANAAYFYFDILVLPRSTREWRWTRYSSNWLLQHCMREDKAAKLTGTYVKYSASLL